MSEVTEFLTPKEEQQIIEAIRMAESHTSGEIRVHIEQQAQGDHFKRATDVFHLLKMDNTRLQNGVLIYIAVSDRKLVILGDKGINEVVEPDFWDCTKDAIITQFKQGFFAQGIIEGVRRAGERLQSYFPWDHDDQDELPNDISKS